MLPGLLFALAISASPIFDIEKGCRLDTEAAQEDNGAYQTCVRDEEAAKTKVSTQWSRYPIDWRTTCSSAQTDDFDGSYVELMTCLEIQDWKNHLDDVGHLNDVGGHLATGSSTIGGSPLTPSQIGGYSASHPLGGIPAARVH